MTQFSIFLDRFRETPEKPAIIWGEDVCSYRELVEYIDGCSSDADLNKIKSGTIVALEGDFSPRTIALLYFLISKNAIIVPLSRTVIKDREKLYQIAGVEISIEVDTVDNYIVQKHPTRELHKFYKELQKNGHPGLVLFTSGTSGEPKCAVHDLSTLLAKFEKRKKSSRILNFLLFDHWGGLNTMFHILSNNGALIVIEDRSPAGICRIIEKYQVEVLPTSPTFLNLLLLSKEYNKFDLESLKLITYGTEPMPEGTLKKLKEVFPETKLLQTYGLIELGVMKSESRSDDSVWVKVGGEGYDIRVVDGILHIKAKSAMLGYLNAPSPFTDDGYFVTGDAVEVDGEWMKILGRKSELINVGGEKVYPVEVEDTIRGYPNVAEVTVFGEKNPLIGSIVCANITLIDSDIDYKEFIGGLKSFCAERLARFKVPVKVEIVEVSQISARFKKSRTR